MDASQDVQAVHARQVKVEDEDVVIEPAKPVQDDVAPLDHVDVEIAFQEITQELPYPGLVVGDEYFISAWHQNTRSRVL